MSCFSCSQCGEKAWLTVTDPRRERGMEDYRLDQPRIRSAIRPPSIDCSADVALRR